MNPSQGQGIKSAKGSAAGDSQSTQSLLQIVEIREGMVVLKDGSFRAVIMCQPVNFDLMSQAEQEGVEYSYQAFLNSLYFPIQISIQSRKVDASHYLEQLRELLRSQNNMLLSLLTEEYLYFMSSLVDNTEIMDKAFYVIIPFSPHEGEGENIVKSTKGFFNKIFRFNQSETPVVLSAEAFENAKVELRHRAQSVLEGLNQCGVKGLVLDTKELIELYYSSYNPDSASRQHLGNFEDIGATYVSQGQAPGDGYGQ